MCIKKEYTYIHMVRGRGSGVVLRPERGGQKSLSEGKEGGEEKGGGLIP